jgi:hypothetical protein
MVKLKLFVDSFKRKTETMQQRVKEGRAGQAFLRRICKQTPNLQRKKTKRVIDRAPKKSF